MTAEETLKAKLPKGCIWEEGGNLTNTPIELVAEIMNEYADADARQMAVGFAEWITNIGVENEEGKLIFCEDVARSTCSELYDTFTATDRKEDGE